jgi:16S rRNA (guanine527-N7)-methyltransferase
MIVSNDKLDRFLESLAQNAPDYQVKIGSDSLRRLGGYFSFINRWNERLHLVAPCSPEEFATRHFLESLLLIKYLPQGAAIADIGSGAGFPLIPCLIVRADLQGYLIEASKKKAIFLHEALKETQTTAAVINKQFQETPSPLVQFISCRAIERFESRLPEIVDWAPKSSFLLLFAGEDLRTSLDALQISYTAYLIPKSQKRYLYVAENPPRSGLV